MSEEQDLVVVVIETTVGDRYTFPRVPRSMLNNALKHDQWVVAGNVILANDFAAVLSVPLGTVAGVFVEDTRVWPNG